MSPPKGTFPPGLGSVSYTHLDVYKRQLSFSARSSGVSAAKLIRVQYYIIIVIPVFPTLLVLIKITSNIISYTNKEYKLMKNT